MKILMFSWEYPPISHGGLARHVQDLSEALVEQDHTVYIITQGSGDIAEKETMNGVIVIRTRPVSISANNFIDSILHLNFLMLEKVFELIGKIGEVDLIQGHDWLVFWASRVLKYSLQKPLIYTIHATEFGRNQGIYNDMQRYINDVEWYSTFEAWKVIVCSNYMESEVKNLFQVPDDKIVILPNGVEEDNYRVEVSAEFLKKYASPYEKIVYYVGRIVREKGIQVLIQSIPIILEQEPGTKFIIAGKGPYLDNLKAQAEFLGVSDRIYFTGFISDETRNKLYQMADVAVFPSIYEPFGIVALEAMVTRTPVIVSKVGGLAEFVEDGVNGLTVNPNDTNQLAGAILRILKNKTEAARIAEKGYKMVKDNYSWDKIARQTVTVYRDVLKEYLRSNWNLNKAEEAFLDRYEARLKYI